MEHYKNKILLENIVAEGSRHIYTYRVMGPWKKMFRKTRTLSIEYTLPERANFLSDNISRAVAAIPFVANMLPVAWVMHAEIIVDELDADFYNCTESVRTGYMEMHPEIEFYGKLTARPVESAPVEGLASALFFSGGIDAFCSLFSHIDEKPLLFTIWGTDVFLSDETGWNNVKQRVEKTAETYGLETATAKTNFRSLLREGALSRLVEPIVHDNWWHAFQHGIGLLGHAAVVAYSLGIRVFYIASSYSEEVKGQYTCASDPVIDNKVRFNHCSVVHDGYDLNRQRKVQVICNFADTNRKKVPLHVCWQSSGGYNCGVCEKCCRSIAEILAEGRDPSDYDFTFGVDQIPQFKKSFETRIVVNDKSVLQCYTLMQEQLIRNWDKVLYADQLVWLRDMDFMELNNYPEKLKRARHNRRFSTRLYKKVKGMWDRIGGNGF